MRDEPLTPEQIKEWDEFEASLPTLAEMRAEYIESIYGGHNELLIEKMNAIDHQIYAVLGLMNRDIFQPNEDDPQLIIALAALHQAWSAHAGLLHTIKCKGATV